MGLQIWMPLNGSIENQGLNGNLIITNSGATINNNGKIGQCYYFDGTDDKIIIDGLSLGNQWSYGCWVLSPTSSRGWEGVIIFNNNGGDADMQLGMYTYPGGTRIQSTANGQYNSGIINFTYGQWNHFFATFNGSSLKTYINGILIDTKTITNGLLTRTKLTIGARCRNTNGSSYDCYFNGYINDVRLYDQVLSDKEIEELAKGLVLHYKLDDAYVETANILSCSITETAYNGSTGKYGYNDTSNLIKTTGVFQGKECVKVGTRTAGVSARPYVYFGNLFTSDGTNAAAYKTLSFDYYTTVPTTTRLNIYKLGSGSGTVNWKTINSKGTHTGTYTNSADSIIVEPNEWNHIEVVLHGTTSANAEWGYCINGVPHTTAENYYFLFANIQLEENDHATGYGSNFHNSIIYDSSGYQYHGTLNSAIKINSNTARYSYSTLFDGVNSSITIPYKTVNPSGIFTVNLWFFKDSLGSENYETLFGGPSGFEMDVRAGSSTTLSLYMASTRGGNVFSPFSLNTWYMVTMVRDGTNEKYYINGELKKTIEAKSMPNGTYYIGSWASITGQSYYGNISDFRLYATCLTDAQILELYNTSSTIDNLGTIHVRELVE